MLVQYPSAPNSPRNWMKKMIRIGLWNQDHSYPRLPFSKIPVLKYLLGCFRGKSVSRVCWDMKLKSQDYSLKVSTQTNRMKLFFGDSLGKLFSDFKRVLVPMCYGSPVQPRSQFRVSNYHHCVERKNPVKMLSLYRHTTGHLQKNPQLCTTLSLTSLH